MSSDNLHDKKTPHLTNHEARSRAHKPEPDHIGIMSMRPAGVISAESLTVREGGLRVTTHHR